MSHSFENGVIGSISELAKRVNVLQFLQLDQLFKQFSPLIDVGPCKMFPSWLLLNCLDTVFPDSFFSFVSASQTPFPSQVQIQFSE